MSVRRIRSASSNTASEPLTAGRSNLEMLIATRGISKLTQEEGEGNGGPVATLRRNLRFPHGYGRIEPSGPKPGDWRRARRLVCSLQRSSNVLNSPTRAIHIMEMLCEAVCRTAPTTAAIHAKPRVGNLPIRLFVGVQYQSTHYKSSSVKSQHRLDKTGEQEGLTRRAHPPLLLRSTFRRSIKLQFPRAQHCRRRCRSEKGRSP